MSRHSTERGKTCLFSAPRLWAAPPLPDLGPISRRAPQLAGDIAFRHFCEPVRSERREAGHIFLVRRARRLLDVTRSLTIPTHQGLIPVYVFEPESKPRGTVLIAHGWTAEASFMTLFAERLRHAGFRAIALDAPAHGKSLRTRASLLDYTDAVLGVAEAFGPVTGALGHSMGCLAILHAGAGGPPFHRNVPFSRYVLVSPPNRITSITQQFAAARHMTGPARAAFERHLERIAHRPLTTFTAAHLLAAADRPALILHAPDDLEVPLSDAEDIAWACPKARLLAFDGLGHRKILSNPAVVRAAISFLTES